MATKNFTGLFDELIALQPTPAPPEQGNDIYAFFVSTAINLAICLGLFLLFSLMRTRVSWAYSPRFRQDPSQCPPLPSGLLSWIPALVAIDEEVIFKYAGLDALMFIKFFARSAYLFIVGLLIGAAMLATNWFGGNQQKGFGAIGLSNVQEGSRLLICHVVGIYVFTLWCFYLLRRTYADYVILRHRFFIEKHGTASRSVLVNYLPPHCRTQEQIEKFFLRAYPNSFESAAIANWSPARSSVFNERVTALTHLEVALSEFAQKKKRPTIRKYKNWFAKVDAIDYYSSEVKRLNDELAAIPLSREATAGFVTFKTLRDAHEASMVRLDTTPFAFQCRLAPELRDVCWENLGRDHRVKFLREVLGHVMVCGLIFLSFIPIAAISAITTLPNLIKILPESAAQVLTSNEVLSGFLTGFLPSLANLVFLALLPILLRAIAKFEGLEAHSWIEERMASFFFAFVVITFFITQTLAGSLLKIITQILSNFNVNEVIALLANSIPQYGYFFGIFILMRAFVTVPLALLDPATLIITFFRRSGIKTERQLRDVEKLAPVYYGQEFSNHLLIFVIATAYAMIQPIIMLFAAIYFSMAYVCGKYRVLYIAFPNYESGGVFWPDVFTRMCIGLLLSELTLIGVFGLKQVPVQAGFLVPLPFLTFTFWRYVRNEFFELSQALPVTKTTSSVCSPITEGNVYACPENNAAPVRVPEVTDARLIPIHGETYFTFKTTEEEIDHKRQQQAEEANNNSGGQQQREEEHVEV